MQGAPGNPARALTRIRNLTPLMYAAISGDLDIVKMLISAGSDVNVLCTCMKRINRFPFAGVKMAAFSYITEDPRDTMPSSRLFSGRARMRTRQNGWNDSHGDGNRPRSTPHLAATPSRGRNSADW